MKKLLLLLLVAMTLSCVLIGCSKNRAKIDDDLTVATAGTTADTTAAESSAPAESESEPAGPHKLTVTAVEEYYYLTPQAGHTYEPKHMIDGDPSTVWAVHIDYNMFAESQDNWGPVFDVKCSKLAYVVIRNGYGRSVEAFKNNARASRVNIYNYIESEEYDGLAEGTTLIETVLKDTSEPQKINISPDAAGNKNLKRIQLQFPLFDEDGKGYYPGAKWDDLCISEVEFWGYE